MTPALIHLPGYAGASIATGPTVVIDTFRAFSTCAYALAAGVERLVLAAEITEARAMAAAMPHAMLGGEEDGAKPAGFDIGNSPAEVLACGDLSGTTLIHRTSAGTRSVHAAITAGAGPVWAASLVVAAATWRVVRRQTEVTVVACGRHGVEPSDEDDAVADYFTGSRENTLDVVELRSRVEAGEGASRLRLAPWAHADDLELCLDIDRFDFAMAVAVNGHLVELRRTTTN